MPKLPLYKCKKCEHEWTPRTSHPVQCPMCRNRNWQYKKANPIEVEKEMERALKETE
jgi:Zn finger protein HypA/HybF involved in hydrogenase expression